MERLRAAWTGSSVQLMPSAVGRQPGEEGSVKGRMRGRKSSCIRPDNQLRVRVQAILPFNIVKHQDASEPGFVLLCVAVVW
jgi:hypothetical protein